MLESHASRKPSEERRISQIPSLDTIDDDQKHDENVLDETLTASAVMKKAENLAKSKVVLSIGNVNLTESSSSGSVCESVVTAYEHSSGKKEKHSSSEGGLDGIFKTSSLLLSKTPKPRKETELPQSHPIQYNNEDMSILDHRVKLYLFQNVFEANDEKLIWLIKCLVIEDEANSTGRPQYSLVVMSTKKVYVLRIVGAESDDIASWLKKTFVGSIDRIEEIRAIPWKAGFSFVFQSTANIHLLLQDRNVTDRLRSHITTSSKFSCSATKHKANFNHF